MEKKPSNVKFVIRLTVVLTFFAIMLFPLALMALDGPDRGGINETEKEMKEFSLEAWFDASFQQQFEGYFSTHFPLRSTLLKSFREMQIDLGNSTFMIGLMKFLKGDQGQTLPNQYLSAVKPGVTIGTVMPGLPGGEEDNPGGGEDNPGGGDAPVQPPVNIYFDPGNIYAQANRLQSLEAPVEPVGFFGERGYWIGKSGYIYESAYMDDFLGYATPGAPYTTVTDEGMMETIEKLKYIQDELAKRGTTMIFIITPSKAANYSAYIPDWYKEQNGHTAVEGYVRPITRFREMLKNSGINYLDSPKYYQQIGLLATFPKTGIHWNAPAAMEATSELIRMYQKITGQKTVTLTVTGVQSAKEPAELSGSLAYWGTDQDVYGLIYNGTGREGIKDDLYYVSDVTVTNTDAQPLNVLLQTGSFGHNIDAYFTRYKVGNVTKIYYNTTSIFGAGDPLAQNNPELWRPILDGRDLVIFESNEQQIRGEHKGDNQTWAQAAGNGYIGHNVIYDSIYEYLKAHEGEY